MSAHLAVVGAGVLGTFHAVLALRAGHRVTLIERHSEPRGASVRNFGLVTVGARAAGLELDVALRARQVWGQISEEWPGLHFHPNGSMVVATNDRDAEVLHQVVSRPDASIRQWQVLSGQESRVLNPALTDTVTAALYCPLDAAVEPATVLQELRDYAATFPGFQYVPNTDVVSVEERNFQVWLKTAEGSLIVSDYAAVTTGANHHRLFGERLGQAPLRRVFLQMARVEGPGGNVPTSLQNADSLRYYPGYFGPWLDELTPQDPVSREHHMQLLVQQRRDGTLTIGDTHAYDEPFSHELQEAPYEYLARQIELILGYSPRFVSRWSGIYSQHRGGHVAYRDQVSERISIVTGPGGRGNTLAPAIAHESLEGWGLA